MTFPNPFEANPIPALRGVGESLDLDASEVQRLATALYRGAVEPLEKDKRKVAALKGALVRPAAQSIRAEDSRTLTGMGQRLRQGAEAQVADTDAEIMLLASRLGARQSAGELTAKGAGALVGVPVTPGRGACLGPPPCPGAICALHPLNTPEVPHPADYVLVQGMQGDFWWCAPGGAAGGEGGGPSGDTGGITVPPGAVRPPPPPAPCEPCPVGIPPGGTLPAAQGGCTRPDDAPAQAVYSVPWLYRPDRPASIFSECGLKEIVEAYGEQFPASELVQAMQAGAGWYNDYLAGTVQQLPDDDEALVLGFLHGGK